MPVESSQPDFRSVAERVLKQTINYPKETYVLAEGVQTLSAALTERDMTIHEQRVIIATLESEPTSFIDCDGNSHGADMPASQPVPGRD